MQDQLTHSTGAGLVIALATALGLAACSDAPQPDEMQWARAALERNEAIEIVAVDPEVRVFTVRERDGDRLYTVALDEIVAGPASLMTAREAVSAAQPVDAPAPAQPDSPPAPSAPAGAEPADSEPARVARDTAPVAPPEPQAGAEAAGEEAAAETIAETPAYTIERENGRVRVSGPGFSIMSAERTDTELELAATAAPEGDEPIVCEGRRMMHIDGRTLTVNGDAVIARSGCDLHITNSRISATGVAVTASGAKVHVTNSVLDGGLRSLEIADGGKAYIRSSTLDGMVQRFGASELHDLGGNAWQ
ncbi:MAG TPA: hypothetical protein VLT59_16385 [Steroidobacteraceae bacterium]|nr:hypothetical protein [Steroidobacteraceae bacterium]